jgi:Nidogen-like/PEP-CTERM motif
MQTASASTRGLTRRHTRFKRGLLGLATALLMPLPAFSIELLSGLGGESGFGELAMQANDDDSSNRLDLPFTLNFFGSSYTDLFVNNNGNVSFLSGIGGYTPEPFPVANQPMIAPWWADVDTRGGAAGLPHNAVFIAAPNADTVVVTWSNVGYFSNQTDKRNDFQLVIRNRADTGAGNFDFDFRYQRLEWTTGSASGGSNGLGGTPAQAGYDDGRGVNYQTLPGSRTDDVLNLVNLSNVSTDTPGLWTFAVRNGDTPGSSASNPLMPVTIDDSFSFQFNVQLGQTVFIDPVVAVGYDYVLSDAASPSFQSVVLPDVGDGLYALYLWDGSVWVDSGNTLQAGVAYDFGAGGVRQFSIRGIEVTAGLDPSNTLAFVTGLTFTDAGTVSMLQTPITVTTAVPEPQSYALMLLGLGGLAGVLRRRRKSAMAS